MGKTGTTLWAQVKGVKGQIRLVPKKEGEAKTPGPNQRFKAGAKVQQLDQIAEAQGGRGGSRGGRGRRAQVRLARRVLRFPGGFFGLGGDALGFRQFPFEADDALFVGLLHLLQLLADLRNIGVAGRKGGRSG